MNNIDIKKLVPGLIAIVVSIVLFVIANLAPIKIVGKWVLDKDDVEDYVDYLKEYELPDDLEDGDDVKEAAKDLEKKLEKGHEFSMFGNYKEIDNYYKILEKYMPEADEDEEDEEKVTYKYRIDGDEIVVTKFVDGDEDNEYEYDFDFDGGKLEFQGDELVKRGFLGFITLSGVISLLGIAALAVGVLRLYKDVKEQLAL